MSGECEKCGEHALECNCHKKTLGINMKNYFYYEWAKYESADEREKAELYLQLWKYFLLKELPEEAVFLEDQIIDRPEYETFIGGQVTRRFSTLAIKICVQHNEITSNELGRFDAILGE